MKKTVQNGAKPSGPAPPEAAGDEIIQHKYQHTADEKQFMTEEVLRDTNKAEDIEAELKEYVKEKKDEIAVLRMNAKKNRTFLRNGFELRDRDCWIIPDAENGQMNYVDKETDEVLWTRRMIPEEKKLYPKTVLRKVSGEE